MTRSAGPGSAADAVYVEALRVRAAVMKEMFGLDCAPAIEAEVKRAGG